MNICEYIHLRYLYIIVKLRNKYIDEHDVFFVLFLLICLIPFVTSFLFFFFIFSFNPFEALLLSIFFSTHLFLCNYFQHFFPFSVLVPLKRSIIVSLIALEIFSLSKKSETKGRGRKYRIASSYFS